ncbi:MAG TPA: adenosylcobinamide-GDP ribazoletransferase [Phycisphaerae bacterium]|nr:adenosylcobinamide-GDP ribazoletransferase [Phycisphaerae bacterium]
MSQTSTQPPDSHTARRPAQAASTEGQFGLRAGAGAAARFLLAFGRADDRSTRGCSAAPPWFIIFGILTGLAWAGLFKGTWRLFGEIGSIRVIPPLAVVLLECLLTGPYLALGLARTIHLLTSSRPRSPALDLADPLSPVGTLILCLTVLASWVLIVSIPAISPWWPSYDDWRYHLRRFYAAPVYRPLLLAPLWGRWTILMAATIGRTLPTADRATQALCSAMRPGKLLYLAIVPLSLTSIYMSRERNYVTGIIVGLLVFVITYLVSVVMARRGGGQTRQSLYAAGQIGQLAFLGLYRLFWPLIHG